MIKETVICIIIIVAILGLDILTQNFTEKTVSEITVRFSSLKENLSKQDTDQIDNELRGIDNKWGEMHKKLAYYIEHDELEKVDTAIVTMKSYIESNEYGLAIAELEEAKFVLEHIQEKNSFNLQNIF